MRLKVAPPLELIRVGNQEIVVAPDSVSPTPDGSVTAVEVVAALPVQNQFANVVYDAILYQFDLGHQPAGCRFAPVADATSADGLTHVWFYAPGPLLKPASVPHDVHGRYPAFLFLSAFTIAGQTRPLHLCAGGGWSVARPDQPVFLLGVPFVQVSSRY